MPLAPGTQLGPYEILSQIGAGGMGEVYKARDTRLDRIVAVKVSKDPFTERFQREARIIAALNHPNVCTLHDVGPNYLVMEFVEGEIPSGPMPYDEAVSVIRQIAEALAAAHEKGVVHRDLKPGNILVKADGTVKVLDFGLARSTVPEPGSVDETVPLTNSIPLTEAGVAVGTVAYMSPEQAQGKPVDKRADIWAFGVVFYELLTGTRLFKGATLPDTLVAVMTREPDWARVSAKAQPLLRSCLERDPRKRLRDIGDAMALLTGSAAQSPARRPWLAWGATGLVLATLLPVVVRHLREPVPVRESTRFQIPLPEGMNFASQGSVSVSPDGRKVVFGASGPDGVTRLWLRSLDSLEIRPLPGTESSDAPLPFWSPDSQTLAVYTGTKLRRLDLAGGSMRDICELGYLGFGGDWNREDLLLVGGGVGGIKRVPATGGAPVELTVPDPSRQDLHHEMPFFLPDQRRFLYFRHSITPGNSGVYLGSMDAKPEEQRREPVLATDLPAVFVPSSDAERGELLFLRDDTLYAQAFDTKRAALTGDATPVASVSSLAGGSYGMFSASRTDALVYRAAESRDRQLTWYNRRGTRESTLGEPGRYGGLALSRSGNQVAVSLQDPAGNRDIWRIEASGSATRLTFGPAVETQPVWSPDGARIAFHSESNGSQGLYQILSTGGREELLMTLDGFARLTEWSSDGRFLIFWAINGSAQQDLWRLPLEGDRKAQPFLSAPHREIEARVSPDGRWVAYLSDESGGAEVFVQAYSSGDKVSGGEGKWIVSRSAMAPIGWRADSKELYYVATDRNIMAVELSAGPAFQPKPPARLFQIPPGTIPSIANQGQFVAVAGNGQRFLVAVPLTGNARQEFTVLLNWQAALKR